MYIHKGTKSKIEIEEEVLITMIQLYCKKKHNQTDLCDSCRSLADYATNRLVNCKYGNDKTFCSKCPAPCYSKNQRQLIKQVMRFSGPRMLIYHPIIAIQHLFKR